MDANRFYIYSHPKALAGMQTLMEGGQTVGTLCVYDLQPKAVSAERVEQLRTMARAVVELLAQRQR